MSAAAGDQCLATLQAVAAAVCVGALALLAGCAGRPAAIGAPGDVPVYVVSHGWHTGIAMKAQDVDFDRWRPLPRPGPDAYLEIGWGDRDYYPAEGFNPWYAIKAIAWPTASVLHVTSFDEPPPRRFPASEVIELRLAPAAVEALLGYIAASFAPDPTPVAPALYGAGAFYPSRERFHLFNTCNVWTARALREAQVDARPSLTTESLMAQLRSRYATR